MPPGFVALELETGDATFLQGGAKCRYCVRGPPGRLSEKVAVSAIILKGRGGALAWTPDLGRQAWGRQGVVLPG